MNTSYSEIYKSFLINCPTSDLPQTDEGKYVLLESACSIYNLKSSSYKDFVKSDITTDDTKEELDVILNPEEMLIFVHCLKLAHLKAQLSNYVGVWDTYSKEMGRKFYRESVNARNDEIKSVDDFIKEMLNESVTDWEV